MRASTPTPGSASPCLHSSCFWSRLTTLWATLCRSRTGGLLPSRTRRLAKLQTPIYPREQRLLVQIGLWLAPLTAAFATQLFNIRTKHGEGGVRPCDQVVPCWVPWLGAILACLCHFFWILIILYVSTPVLATAELPVAFRSAIYLDVFGWHSKYFKPSLVHNAKGDISHWEASDMMQSPVPAAELEQDDQRRVFVAFKEGKRLLRGLTKLTDPEVCKHFRDE
ncbi:unnamed protein product, partial [Symbiodinium microadriaticum]